MSLEATSRRTIPALTLLLALALIAFLLSKPPHLKEQFTEKYTSPESDSLQAEHRYTTAVRDLSADVAVAIESIILASQRDKHQQKQQEHPKASEQNWEFISRETLRGLPPPPPAMSFAPFDLEQEPLPLWNRAFIAASDVAFVLATDYTHDKPMTLNPSVLAARREFLNHFWFLAQGGRAGDYRPLYARFSSKFIGEAFREKMTSAAATQTEDAIRHDKSNDFFLSARAVPTPETYFVVFIPTYELEWFIAELQLATSTSSTNKIVKRHFVLVTHWFVHGPAYFSDLSQWLLDQSYLRTWWSQNCNIPHKKMRCLPNGIDWHTLSRRSYWGQPKMSPKQQQLDLVSSLTSPSFVPFENREKAVLLDFALGSNTLDRVLLYGKLGRKSWSKIVLGKQTRNVTWRLYATHQFVLSPPGNGYECHRTYEALALGAIPILKRHSDIRMREKIEGMYQGMPVVFVENYEQEISEETIDAWEKQNRPLLSVSNKPQQQWRKKMTNWFWFDQIRRFS